MRTTSRVSVSSSLHEKILAVSSVGSALGADKKNHLTLGNFYNVDAPSQARTSSQRSSADGRSNGVRVAHRHSLARFAGALWSVEFGLHALASVVSVRSVGATFEPAGRTGARTVAFPGRQQPCGGPTKSGDRTHQGRTEHQTHGLGGWGRPRSGGELGGWTASRCTRGLRMRLAEEIARRDCRGGQRVRQRCLPGAIATPRSACLHSAASTTALSGPMASWLLSAAAQSRKLFSTNQALSPNRHTLRKT